MNHGKHQTKNYFKQLNSQYHDKHEYNSSLKITLSKGPMIFLLSNKDTVTGFSTGTSKMNVN